MIEPVIRLKLDLSNARNVAKELMTKGDRLNDITLFCTAVGSQG